jgi:hypothetical protein
MSLKFTLREIQPSDGAGISKLITGFDGDLTTSFLVDPYTAIVSGTEYNTTGVVVETPGYDGFVGMGTVRFGTVRYNHEILPLAFLDGLKVHQEFRGNGLGHQIAGWRLEKAREKYGDRCVIGTGMLHDNHASHAVASKWCREFVESGITVRLVPTLTKEPRSRPGISFCEIEPRQYEEFSRKQNGFYSQYNLYPPGSPDSIARALGISVEGRNPYRYFVAIDRSGNLLAGAQTWARGFLKADTLNNIPSSLRILNKLVHLLPPDFRIRDVAVTGLWYNADQVKTAQFLWEWMRWACRDLGTTLAVSLDSRDPLLQIIPLKPWHQPRPKITLAIKAPTSLNRDQLLFGSGRV